MVAALPFKCVGAKIYLLDVSHALTKKLLSFPNISHDVDMDIFSGLGKKKNSI